MAIPWASTWELFLMWSTGFGACMACCPRSSHWGSFSAPLGLPAEVSTAAKRLLSASWLWGNRAWGSRNLRQKGCMGGFPRNCKHSIRLRWHREGGAPPGKVVPFLRISAPRDVEKQGDQALSSNRNREWAREISEGWAAQAPQAQARWASDPRTTAPAPWPPAAGVWPLGHQRCSSSQPLLRGTWVAGDHLLWFKCLSPSEFHVDLVSVVVVLGGVTSGRCLGHEYSALMGGINAIAKG